MGRSRRRFYIDRRFGALDLRADRGKPGRTAESVVRFADSSPGPVATQLVQQELVDYNARGELELNARRIGPSVEVIKAELVSAREYPREEFAALAGEATGLSPRQALNAETRTYQARVEAIYAAAEATGHKISPTDKRILNPLREGRFVDVLYGKQGQYEGGTLMTRVKGARRPRSTDSRVQALREQLREYRYGENLERVRSIA